MVLPFPLTQSQLDYATALMRSVMTSNCRVEHHGAPVPSGGGEWTTPVTTTDVACLIAPGGVRPLEEGRAGALAATAPFDVTLPAGTPVDASDLIHQLDAAGGTVVRTFQVMGVRAPRSLEIRRVCLCVERS